LNRIITIIGPTASGKTEFSVRLAKKLNAEIIGLDSRQIYKGMIVGTAQPSKSEQRGIPHHLINILPLSETVSAGSYSTLVREAVSKIYSRSKIPLICGGAGLYYRALVNGIFAGSRTDNKIRKRLENEYDKTGPQQMLSKLKKYDPDYAKSIHPNNKKRLVRALEILESTGTSPSKNFKSQKQTVVPKLNLFTIYLNWDRSVLKDRIASRTNNMLNNGWIEEVKKIINKYPNQTLHPLDSIGYREIISYLKGELTLEVLEKTIIIKTRQFAKRQIQWFKNEKINLTIDMDHFDINNIDNILNKIKKEIQ
jgi:tRNA dimethylallyltransferase